MAEEFLEVSGRDGLVPNWGKTQLLSNNKKVEKFEIKREKIERVTEAIYLGQPFHSKTD